MKYVLFILIVAMIGFSMAGCFKQFKPADNDKEYAALMVKKNIKIIRSLDEFDKWMKEGRSDFSKIYNRMSEKNKADFRESLVFNNGGFAGCRLDVLFNQEVLEEFETVVNLIRERKMKEVRSNAGTVIVAAFSSMRDFGISSNYVADHTGYYCRSRATCAKRQYSICTSNC